MESAFVLGVIFTFIIILVWLDSRKKERMFLLRQGKDLNILESKKNPISSIDYVKWGIIVASIGCGALAGTLCSNGKGSLYIAFLMIFSGLGLFMSFLVTRKMVSDQPLNKEPKPEVRNDEENSEKE